MNKFLKIAGVVLILTLAVVLTGVVFVSAQDETPPPDESTTPDTTENEAMPFGFGRHGHGGHRGQHLVDPEVMHEAIADALGITVDELDDALASGQTLAALAEELGVDMADVQAAVEAVHEEALQQAVDEGLLTEEQADLIRERRAEMELGQGFGGRGRFGGCGGRMGGFLNVDRETMHTAVADALGISVEELDAALADGQSLASLAEEKGVDMADVQAAMQAVRDEAIQQAVEDGLITQEQADLLKEQGGLGLGFGRGHDGHGRGGHFGGPRGNFGGGLRGTFGNGTQGQFNGTSGTNLGQQS